jgi:cephalosporin hydroxylase
MPALAKDESQRNHQYIVFLNPRRWPSLGFGFLKCISRFVFWSIFGSFLVASAARKLTNRVNEISDIDEAVKFVFSFRYLGITIVPSQIPDEITALLRLLATTRPEVVLEIGTACGGTLFLLTWAASPSASIISLDLPPGFFSGGYPKQKSLLYRSFARNKQNVCLIRADSHNPSTIEAVREATNGQEIDVLFIDGDHSYEGVKKDFEMYSPLVKKGGIIAFHDISPGPNAKVGGVPVLWNEIEHRYRSLRIAKDCGEEGFGIGVLFV